MQSSLARGVSILLAAVLVAQPTLSYAQIAGAAERAAARAAARAAERKAADRAASQAASAAARREVPLQAKDVVVRRWSSALCKPASRCPLPERVGNTFNGGSYREVVLGSDTLLYRVHATPATRLGAPGGRYSYWSRSDARGLQASVDGAIPVSRNGNTGQFQSVIRVPRGTRVFEGETHGLGRGGPVGGGNQVVLGGVRPEWLVRP
jgi:hypothetical protein